MPLITTSQLGVKGPWRREIVISGTQVTSYYVQLSEETLRPL